MQLFYYPKIETDTLIFDKPESEHIVRVLRKKPRDVIAITNGMGSVFDAVIVEAHPKKCVCEILSKKNIPQKKHNIHIAVAPPKSRDRLEWLVEKVTEIGVSSIQLFLCENSERTVVNIKRLEGILISAMKQSNQFFLPKIFEPIPFKSLVENTTAAQKYIGFCSDDYQRMPLEKQFEKEKISVFVVGPEGDFSQNEIVFAVENGFIPVSLGDNRLRTETATVVACYALNYLNTR